MARAPKIDPQLAEAVDDARAALAPVVPQEQIGEHLGAHADADRLVTHRFAALLPGYAGWEWYVTLSRASRSKTVTVSESGLLPGPDALLAPPWVPWAERMAPEEVAAAKAVADQQHGAVAGPDDAAPAAAAAAAAGGASGADAAATSDGDEDADETDAAEAAGESDPAEADEDDAAPARSGRRRSRRRRR